MTRRRNGACERRDPNPPRSLGPAAPLLGVANHDGTGVGQTDRVVQHLLKFLRARWRQNTHSGNFREQSHVVDAVMTRTVISGDPGAIEAEDHGKAMQGDVVDDLIPSARQECRIERDDRTHATHGHSGGTRDRVLLGDAHVEESVGETFLKRQESGGAGHGGRDCHHA